MGWFVLRRLFGAAVLVVVVPSLSFVYFTAIYIGGPVFPQLRQYLDSVFLHADFGRLKAPGARAVSDVLHDGIPVDVALLAGGFVLGLTLGILAGAQIAAHPRSRRAAALNGVGALALAAPTYATAFLIVVYFGSVGGTHPLFFVSDGGVYRSLTDDPLAWLHALWVPWLAIALPVAGTALRLTASSTQEALSEDPVRSARAKGISDRTVLRRHAVPFAIPTLSAYTGASMSVMILNIAIVERIFNLPGSFRLTQDSIQNVDFVAIQGLVLVTAFYVAVANLAADLVLGRVDPRTR